MLKGFIKSETLEKLGFEKQGILYWKDLHAIEEDKVDTEEPVEFYQSDTEVFDYMTKDGLYLKAEWVQLDNISKALTLSTRFGGNLDKESLDRQKALFVYPIKLNYELNRGEIGIINEKISKMTEPLYHLSDYTRLIGQETVSNTYKEKSERIEKLFENLRTSGIKIEDPHLPKLSGVAGELYRISVDKARVGHDDYFAVTTYIDYDNLYKKLGYTNSGEE